MQRIAGNLVGPLSIEFQRMKRGIERTAQPEFAFELQKEKSASSVIALPPNNALQLTGRIVTPLAYARDAPIRQAAELGR